MELFTIGFPAAVTPDNLLYCFLGVFLGTFIGVLPGIGGITAVSLLLPISFYLDPMTALIFLSGIYYGAEYGGSLASVLLNLPGTASNAITCLDGYPMAQAGRAGVALLTTKVASFAGGCFGILLLIFLSPLMSSLALSFGAADYFTAMLLGLIAASTVGRGSPLKGIAMVVLGLLLGGIGMDVNTGIARYNLGLLELQDGLHIAIIAMGLFGVSELIASATIPRDKNKRLSVSMSSMIPTRDDVRRALLPMLRGAGVGSVFGTLPGTGQSIASFMSYALEKRTARDPSRFGQGAIEGIAGPEASNNAAVQTAFIPTLSLGIPGTATMAILLAAMLMQGITPGPNLVSDHPELFWGLIASFWIGNVMLLILNIPLIGLWIRILAIPYNLLYPSVIALICVGVYSLNLNIFDVWVLLVFSLIGYGMRLVGFEPAPLILGFVLGPLIEENFRRAMLLARGDFLELFMRPISGTLIAVSAVIVIWRIYSFARQRSRYRPSEAPAD